MLGVKSMNRKSILKREHKNKDYNIITLQNPNGSISECYRRIKVGIKFSSINRKVQVIEVTSPNQNDGKTITLLNLAATFIEDKKKVLIIDMDLRRPKIHHAFKSKNENGLDDYLVGDIPLSKLVKHSSSPYIDYIVRGSKVPYPLTVLDDPSIKKLIDSFRDQYDYILLDCPPILAVSDALIIATYADAALFIVSQMFCNKNDAILAMKYLKDNDVPILGVVFTNVTKKNSNYSHDYNYYSYKKRYYGDKK